MNAFDIYNGSNGDATKALYARLEAFGPLGVIAMNLFRAQKASARAKVYSKRFKGQTYEKKNWSIQNVCDVLTKTESERFIWGWKIDPEQPFHKWVLYVELPTGQISFHSETRGAGPDYLNEWDRSGCSAERICKWVQIILDSELVECGQPVSNP